MDFRTLIPFGRSPASARPANEFEPFVGLRREIDRVFHDFMGDWTAPSMFGGKAFLSPKVDVAETEKGMEITAELPGVDLKNIALDYADGVVTLKAERKQEEEKEEGEEKKRYHLVERSYGAYLRRFVVPFEPEADKIEAAFDKGVLKVSIPRSPEAAKQTMKIDVKGA